MAELAGAAWWLHHARDDPYTRTHGPCAAPTEKRPVCHHPRCYRRGEAVNTARLTTRGNSFPSRTSDQLRAVPAVESHAQRPPPTCNRCRTMAIPLKAHRSSQSKCQCAHMVNFTSNNRAITARHQRQQVRNSQAASCCQIRDVRPAQSTAFPQEQGMQLSYTSHDLRQQHQVVNLLSSTRTPESRTPGRACIKTASQFHGVSAKASVHRYIRLTATG